MNFYLIEREIGMEWVWNKKKNDIFKKSPIFLLFITIIIIIIIIIGFEGQGSN